MPPAPPLIKKPTGCYGVLVGLFLVFCPPIGLALLAIRNPWAKKTGNVLAFLSTVWLAAIVIGLFYIPFDPPASDTPVNADTEAAEFRSFVDRAIEIRNSIDEFQERLEDAWRSGNPTTSEEFHRQSLTFRNQVEILRAQFHARFGTEIGEYRMRAKGKNDQLFLKASQAVNRLNTIWVEWHSAIVRGRDLNKLNMHDGFFWDAINDARHLLASYDGRPPTGSKERD